MPKWQSSRPPSRQQWRYPTLPAFALILIGAIVTANGFTYETTVYGENPFTGRESRYHNIGLLTKQICVVILGVGLMLMGAVYWVGADILYRMRTNVRREESHDEDDEEEGPQPQQSQHTPPPPLPITPPPPNRRSRQMTCPACGSAFGLTTQTPGTTIACPRCRQSLMVP